MNYRTKEEVTETTQTNSIDPDIAVTKEQGNSGVSSSMDESSVSKFSGKVPPSVNDETIDEERGSGTKNICRCVTAPGPDGTGNTQGAAHFSIYAHNSYDDEDDRERHDGPIRSKDTMALDVRPRTSTAAAVNDEFLYRISNLTSSTDFADIQKVVHKASRLSQELEDDILVPQRQVFPEVISVQGLDVISELLITREWSEMPDDPPNDRPNLTGRRMNFLEQSALSISSLEHPQEGQTVPGAFFVPGPNANSDHLNLSGGRPPSEEESLSALSPLEGFLVDERDEEDLQSTRHLTWLEAHIQRLINRAPLVHAMATVPTLADEEPSSEIVDENRAWFALFLILIVGGGTAILMTVPRTSLPPQSSAGKAIGHGTFTQKPALLPTSVPTSWDCNLHIRNTVLTISGPVALDGSTSQNAAMRWLLHNDTRLSQRSGDNDSSSLKQRYVLALMYFSLHGEHWKKSGGFLSGRGECEWVGVKCNHSSNIVTEINLRDNNLTGRIPDEIFELTSLKLLDLEYNLIYGHISDTVGSLGHLESLKLGKNLLNSTIPESIGNLTRLRTLSLFSNILFGTLPRSIGNLSELGMYSLAVVLPVVAYPQNKKDE